MSILTATNLSQSHGFTDVFVGISVSVTPDAKIGLIGPNGVGKTTLLRVLAGMDKPVTGGVSVARGKRVGYLPQEAMDAFAGDANTVHAEMLTAFEHLHAIEARMRELEEIMAGAGADPRPLKGGPDSTRQPPSADSDGPGSGSRRGAGTSGQGSPSGVGGLDDALHEYGELQDRFTHGGGYDYETRIAQVLDGLGFNRVNWDTPVAHLSGGQKTRALLARLLLEQPDLLILDEPTNHLDVEALEWLEKLLIGWGGALLICSHDRFFLDRVVNRIWEMSRTKVEVYRGNYTAYTQQRDERFDRGVFVFQQEKARLENELRLIKRDLDNVKGGNGDKVVTWAKGKLRRMTREIVAIETLGAETLVNENWSDIAERLSVPFPFTYDEAERRVRGLRAPSRPQRVRLSLSAARRSGDIVLRTKGLIVGYRGPDDRGSAGRGRAGVRPADTRLFDGDVELRWKDRAALIGPNGAGKTTFIRTALGAIPPLAGEVELGPSVVAAYFAQAHDELNADARVIEEVQKHRRLSDGEARHYLAQFLFTNDDAFKPVSGLSGGERARLALAILQLKGANLLILDEPTNHLDIAAQEELQAALEGYDGTILLVSHDRYLIDKLATHIWHIEDRRLHAFRGSYAEWTKWRAAQAAPRRVEARAEGGKPKAGAAAQNDRAAKSAEKKRQQQVAEAEARVAALEAKLKELAEAMQKHKGTVEVTSLGIEYALAQRELDEAMQQWEAMAA